MAQPTAHPPAASPAKQPPRGRRGARGPLREALFLGDVLVTGALLFAGIWLTFFHAPVEAQMGFVQKIFYFHVPVAWVMFLSVGVTAIGSLVYLIKKSEAADRLAQAGAELAALFGLMVLVTGPLWGWKAWGTPWVWDVRLTSTLLLELILLAYLMVRLFGGSGARSLSAGLALFGVVQVPLIYWSVDLWRSTHPPRLVSKGGLDADMATALIVSTFAFMFLFVVLLSLRLSVSRARARIDELHLLAEEAGLEDL